MFLRCSQNKDGMTGRLFQRFQKSIESRCGEHMYFIDNVCLIFTDLWRDTHLLHQLADIVHRIIGSSIQFMDIVRPLFIKSHTRLTLIASFAISSRRHAVNGFGKDTCARSLSDSAWPAEQISMSKFLSSNRIFQRSGQRPLSHHRFESGRTIFTG